MKKTGIIIVNMGGPTSLIQMYGFLFRMFTDSHILPVYPIFRYLLAGLITSTRGYFSWKKYKKIGGTPVKKATQSIVNGIKAKLGNEYLIEAAYSYSRPLVSTIYRNMIKKQVGQIKLVSLYPQRCFCTSVSVKDDAQRSGEKYNSTLPVRFLQIYDGFYKNKNFLLFLINLIKKFLLTRKELTQPPHLLFSAHSVPKKIILDGDCYVSDIEESANAIASALNFEYSIGYQSGLGKVEWVGPDTKDVLKTLSEKKINSILIIPISFVCENLETLYDLDLEIIPLARKTFNFKEIERIHFPENDSSLNQAIIDTLQINDY